MKGDAMEFFSRSFTEYGFPLGVYAEIPSTHNETWLQSRLFIVDSQRHVDELREDNMIVDHTSLQALAHSLPKESHESLIRLTGDVVSQLYSGFKKFCMRRVAHSHKEPKLLVCWATTAKMPCPSRAYILVWLDTHLCMRADIIHTHTQASESLESMKDWMNEPYRDHLRERIIPRWWLPTTSDLPLIQIKDVAAELIYFGGRHNESKLFWQASA